MDTNKMREQFESFARDVLDWSDDEFRLASDGKSYYWGSTGEAWVFWQASRAAVLVELPDRTSEAYQEYFDDVEGGSFNEAAYIRDVRTVIEAQGLRVTP